jgi:hypothetical protein
MSLNLLQLKFTGLKFTFFFVEHIDILDTNDQYF